MHIVALVVNLAVSSFALVILLGVAHMQANEATRLAVPYFGLMFWAGAIGVVLCLINLYRSTGNRQANGVSITMFAWMGFAVMVWLTGMLSAIGMLADVVIALTIATLAQLHYGSWPTVNLPNRIGINLGFGLAYTLSLLVISLVATFAVVVLN